VIGIAARWPAGREVALRRVGWQSGSATLALATSGTVQTSVLYDLYGQVQYCSGTMPVS
jgi:hypothetical protein